MKFFSSLLIPFYSLFFLLGLAFSSEIEFVRVLEVSGKAEVLRSSSGRWAPLSEGTLLQKGSKIRTKHKSTVQIAFDRDLVSVAKLEENSRLDILSSPSGGFSLERGQLFLFRENESGKDENVPRFRVLTQDAQVAMGLGGCIIELFKTGTSVRVFGERVGVVNRLKKSVKSKPNVIDEGFRFLIDREAAGVLSERMKFSDYAEWQMWIKKLYQNKDKVQAVLFEKGLVS